MTEQDQDQDLRELWQSSPSVDVDDLYAKVKREDKRVRRLFLLDLLGSVIATIFFIYVYLQGAFGSRLWLLILMIVGVVIYQWWTWRWRDGLWSAHSQAPLDLLKFQRKRAMLGVKLARLCSWGAPISLFLGGLVAYITRAEEFSFNLSRPVKIVLMVSMALIILASMVMGWRAEKRRKLEISQLDQTIKAFEKDQVDDNKK